MSPQSRIVRSRAENIYLAPEKIGYKKVNPVIWQGVSKADVQLLRATRGACNPISRLLLGMRRMYVASIRLDFH